MATIYKDLEFDVDLDDFDTDDLIEEVERRGYTVLYGNLNHSIEKLRSVYLTCSKETFDKELKVFFKEMDMPI
jgi:hypothetical protein